MCRLFVVQLHGIVFQRCCFVWRRRSWHVAVVGAGRQLLPLNGDRLLRCRCASFLAKARVCYGLGGGPGSMFNTSRHQDAVATVDMTYGGDTGKRTKVAHKLYRHGVIDWLYFNRYYDRQILYELLRCEARDWEYWWLCLEKHHRPCGLENKQSCWHWEECGLQQDYQDPSQYSSCGHR